MSDPNSYPAPDPGALSGCCCPLMFCVMTRTHPWIERISDCFFEVSFEAAFRRMVRSYLKRTGMSARAFGLEVGDERLVYRLRQGRGVKLNTAEKALAFMGEPGFRDLFLGEVAAYLEVTGTKPYLLGLEAVGDRSFVTNLREGLSPYLGTIDKVRAWMGAHSTVAERRRIGAATLHKSWLRVGVGAPAGHGAGPDGVGPIEARFLSALQAARYLGKGVRWLDRMRVEGGGPPFYKFGQSVRYTREDLDTWSLTRLRMSTSDDGTGKEIPID